MKTFKLSNDPLFAEKTTDIVELYWNPPLNSVVWSADEQCQLQALMRTQPSLPCAPGHPSTKTNDYKRNGTTTLFAAQNVGSGKVVYMFNKVHTKPAPDALRAVVQLRPCYRTSDTGH